MVSACNSSLLPRRPFAPCYCYSTWLAEFQRAAGLPVYRQPATIRAQVLTCGAILGRTGRRLVIHLSQSWGGLKTRSPLLDNILKWQIPTSPKLETALQT